MLNREKKKKKVEKSQFNCLEFNNLKFDWHFCDTDKSENQSFISLQNEI